MCFFFNQGSKYDTISSTPVVYVIQKNVCLKLTESALDVSLWIILQTVVSPRFQP